MTTVALPPARSVTPSREDSRLASLSQQNLRGSVKDAHPNIELRVSSEEGANPLISVPVPLVAYRLFLQILSDLAEGNTVTIVPLHKEMTTQEAADFLEMSRPSLLKLLEQKQIRFRKVGKHRRILFKDIVEYKQHSMIDRNSALDELVKQAQELNMGY